MAKCPTCGAPVNLAPDGDPKYDPPRQPQPTTTSEAERRVVKAAKEVWQRYQTIILLRPTFNSPAWSEFGEACKALKEDSLLGREE